MALTLVPMTEAAYQSWSQASVATFAEEKVRSHAWEAADALRLSQENFAQLLPDGRASRDHYLYTITAQPGAVPVGILWFARKHNEAYLYEIMIAEEFRGRGYGRQAMHLLEAAVTQLGLAAIALHVFGHNQRALGLYQSLGYETTDLNMRKPLPRRH